MARTRYIRESVTHADDGELLDKEGKPLSTERQEALSTDPIELPPPIIEEPKPVRYRCDATTVQRHMDAWTLFRLLDAIVGPLSIELDGPEWLQLHPDVREQFRRV